MFFYYYYLITRFSAWAEKYMFFLSLFPADYPNPERGAGRQVTRASDSRSVLCEKLRFSGGHRTVHWKYKFSSGTWPTAGSNH